MTPETPDTEFLAGQQSRELFQNLEFVARCTDLRAIQFRPKTDTHMDVQTPLFLAPLWHPHVCRYRSARGCLPLNPESLDVSRHQRQRRHFRIRERGQFSEPIV